MLIKKERPNTNHNEAFSHDDKHLRYGMHLVSPKDRGCNLLRKERPYQRGGEVLCHFIEVAHLEELLKVKYI